MRTGVRLLVAMFAPLVPLGCAAAVAPLNRTLGAVILTTPPEITQTCDVVDPAKPVAERIAAFWPSFDTLFYSQASGELRRLRDVSLGMIPLWSAHAISPKDAAAMKAWTDAVQANDFGLAALGSHQIILFRCFFPASNTATGLDDAAVEQAFRAFALGSNSPAGSTTQARMNGIEGWFYWQAFIDALFELGPSYSTADDRAAWERMQRHVLYGMLLHTYHDTLCPGPACQPKPDFKPPGLKATDLQSLRDYAYDPKTPASLLDTLYPKLAADPAKYPQSTVPR